MPKAYEFTEAEYALAVQLAEKQGTHEEIAAYIGMSPNAFVGCLKKRGYEGWNDFRSTHAPKGKMSLRMKQYDVAMSGNVAMLGKLGEQYLDQAQRSVQEIHTYDEQRSPREIARVLINIITQGNEQKALTG